MRFCFLIWCAVKSMHQARFIQLHNKNKRIVHLQSYLPATSLHKDQVVMLLIPLIPLILQQAVFIGSNSLGDGLEIPCHFGNTIFRYRIHKSQGLDTILRHFVSSMLSQTSCSSHSGSITNFACILLPTSTASVRLC